VTTGLDAAPVTDIKLKMYGLHVDFKDFPTCSLAFVTAHLGAGCPAKSLVASGPISALLGPMNLMGNATNTTPCNPLLNAWNAGGGKVVEFLMIETGHLCGGVPTGAAAPYVVTFRQMGKWLLQDAPLPPDVSTKAANLPFYSSILTNDLTWVKLTRKVSGKPVSFLSSVGCLKGKRPYTMTFTATNGAATETTSIAGNGAC
jgi:hypothetical protein